MAAVGDFRIVLNYRRDDTGGYAGRVYDALSERFGDDHVFMDIDTIEPGTDFAEVIDRAVGACDAFLALIGKRWLTATDSAGRRRLDSPADYVRLEIEAALNGKVRVIPVLLQGAEMPTPEDLPESLAKLARIQAHELSDGRWHYDIARLIETLEKFEREQRAAAEKETAAVSAGPARPGVDQDRERPPGPVPPRRRGGLVLPRGAVLAGAGLAAAALVALLLALVLGGGDPEASPGETAAGPPETTAETSPNPPPPALGKLVYGRQGRIFTVLSDGSRPAPLAEGSAPDWSADGTKVAFARGYDIWVMDADGTGEARLTSGRATDYAPAWSPDGKQLLFDRTERSKTTVWLMNADGSDQHELSDEDGGAPDWSPAGNRIVFQRHERIWVMSADGSGQRPITSDLPGFQLSATWSPDGTKIAFAAFRRYQGEIEGDVHLINPDGTGDTNLTHGTVTRGNYPTWSPDSTKLAIAAPDGLWIINRDGSGLRRIVKGSKLDSPAWAPAPS